MKTLKIPKPIYDFYDDKLIDNTFNGMLKSKEKNNKGTTLYGIYKKIRIMPLFAGLGDYVILSKCIDWLRNNQIKFTETEVRRCMLYFNPALSISERRQLAKVLILNNKTDIVLKGANK